MKISLAKCKSIVDTLPIGFYTGRRIELTLDEKEDTSFYDPMEDKIVISYPIIARRMDAAADGCDEEEAVRSMLYHEVSHAILTPAKNLFNNFQVNCMEDERIETVLRDYYHGVNFRQQLYDIHGGHAPKATNAEGAFFNLVRFGLGTEELLQCARNIVKTYWSMNRNTRRWDRPCGTCRYEDEIDALWRKVCREFRKNPEVFQPKNSSSGQGEEGEEEGNSNVEKYKGLIQAEDLDKEQQMTTEDIKRMVGACLGPDPDLDAAQIAKLNEFQKTIEVIIRNFNKKNKNGNGFNTYSGVFNPRAVARNDYRYFERSMSTQGNNKFGSCHLNLIIDTSGSFYDNEAITNGILKILSDIERKNANFTMDVAFINHEFRLCKTVRERRMVATGGNAIPSNMKEILVSLQKPQTCNYNIILFDGDAICQNYEGKDPKKLFGVFDMKQTTLITDPDNERYMNPPFTSTKVIVTKNYTSELIRHITNALTIAFG